MLNEVSCIYQIRNIINNKIYIGSTCNFVRRKNEHIKLLDKNIHYNSYLQDSWNKYGKDNFDFTILKEIPIEEQFDEEQKFLDKFKPFGKNGYNLSKSSERSNYHPNSKNRTCLICGENFYSRGNHNIYCSYDCSREYYTEDSFARRYNEIINNSFRYIPGYDDWEDFYDSH